MAKIMLLVLVALLCISCKPPQDLTAENIVANSRTAVARLLMDDSSCSGFYIGDSKLITAAHCVQLGQEVTVRDSEGRDTSGTVIATDSSTDVAIVHISDWGGGFLQLWNETLFGRPAVGSQFLAIDFPGYYGGELTFEPGYVKDIRTLKDVRMLVSSFVSFPGGSGGAVISLKNGQVIGLTHGFLEKAMPLGEDNHQHVNISLIVSWLEIRDLLDRAR